MIAKREVGEGGRQAKRTDHLKTTSCISLMAYFYESWDFVGLCFRGVVSLRIRESKDNENVHWPEGFCGRQRPARGTGRGGR